MELLRLALGTLIMRPYVFAFFAAYLVAAVFHLGWRKTVTFTVVGYLIAFASEVSSINNGFPYGWYYYLDLTKDRELWIAGVPFFDSLSYVFLAYCSYATALLVLSPVRMTRGNLVTLETRALRRSLGVLVLSAFFQVSLDIVMDPVALQGKRWFLGHLYGYHEAGVHFGVPLSNYAGWLATSFVLILALQQIDARLGRNGERPAGVTEISCRSLLGPLLYLSVVVFNIVVTILIGEPLMAVTGIFTYTLPLVMGMILLLRRINRYTRDELDEHLQDYPWSVAGRGETGGR